MPVEVYRPREKEYRQSQDKDALDTIAQALGIAASGFGIYSDVKKIQAMKEEQQIMSGKEQERKEAVARGKAGRMTEQEYQDTLVGQKLIQVEPPAPGEKLPTGVLQRFVIGEKGDERSVLLRQAKPMEMEASSAEKEAARIAKEKADAADRSTKENIARWNAQIKRESLEASKKYNERAEKEAEVESKSEKFKALAPEDQTSVKDLAKVRAARQAIRGEINANIVQWDKAKSDKERLQIGNQMIKTLNSTQGSDAVGAEEVKRLASNLEIVLFVNPNRPGEVGRNLEAFRRDVENTRDILSTTIDTVNKEIGAYYGGALPVQPTAAPRLQPTGQNQQTGRPIYTPGQR